MSKPMIMLPSHTRWWFLGLLWWSVLPLLASLPASMVAMIVLMAGSLGIFGVYRPVPMLVRVGMLFMVGLGALWIQAGSHDVKGTVMALFLGVLLLKGSEIRHTRDAFYLICFSLVGPMTTFIMEMEHPMVWGIAVSSLLACFVLGGWLVDMQHQLPTQRFTQYFKRVFSSTLFAMPFALLVFWALPRIDIPLWGMPGQGPQQMGIDENMSPGDWSSLFEDPATAFRVRFTDGRVPPLQDLYWKGLTLTFFDGRSWSLSTNEWLAADEQLPWERSPQADPRIQPYRYTLEMEATQSNHLFTLDGVTQTPNEPPTLFHRDGRLASVQPINRFTQYVGIVSDGNMRLREELDEVRRLRYLQLPEGFNPRALALGEEWAKIHADPRDRVQAALDYFAANFAYSYDPPLLGRNSVDEFLFETRLGFCEHYSSSFAFLMRAAGVPTRVVIGYYGGELNEYGNYWRIRQANAHAWNEVWLEDEGWVRVDPTASLQRTQPRAQGGELRQMLRGFGADNNVLDWLRSNWSGFIADFDAERQRDLLQSIGIGGAPAWLVTLLMVILSVVLMSLGYVLFRQWSKEKKDLGSHAWNTFQQRLTSQGWELSPGMTPWQIHALVHPQLSTEQHSQLNLVVEHLQSWMISDEMTMVSYRHVMGFKPRRVKSK